MSYAFRTPNGTATAGNASGGSVTLTKPSGVVDGDLMLVNSFLEFDTNTWATVPTGWQVGPGQVNTGAYLMQTFWKIANSEPASWAWVPTTNAFRILAFAAYSGAVGSGLGRIDISTTAQGDGQFEPGQTAPTVTTTVDGDLVEFAYANLGGVNPSGATGFATNLRVTLAGTAILDAVKSPAGATGTSVIAGTGTQDYTGGHIAYFLTALAAALTPRIPGHILCPVVIRG